MSIYNSLFASGSEPGMYPLWTAENLQNWHSSHANCKISSPAVGALHSQLLSLQYLRINEQSKWNPCKSISFLCSFDIQCLLTNETLDVSYIWRLDTSMTLISLHEPTMAPLNGHIEKHKHVTAGNATRTPPTQRRWRHLIGTENCTHAVDGNATTAWNRLIWKLNVTIACTNLIYRSLSISPSDEITYIICNTVVKYWPVSKFPQKLSFVHY